MNSRQKTALKKLFPKSFPILRWVIIFLLALGLSSCGEKAGSQEVPLSYGETPPTTSQISRQFSEVSPPEIIQELRPALEGYQPQVAIITPESGEVLQDNTVTVRLQVKDLPIFKDQQWQLGPHLHVILDNQPYIAVYDLNQPLVLPDLSPGTHTLRVFASRPWHESFKNEGAYAQTTFHIFTKTDENNPDPSLPLLTYSRPKDNYGAEPILLDFYLTNAPLHLVAQDDPKDEISDWRIRCTINGESFVLDSWQAVYLKGFKPGKNWVKLEFLDNQGNPVKNAFNSTVRLITYQPKGKDTLARIVRGELKADEVRGIVDPNYTAKARATEPTPTPTKTPAVEKTPQAQPKVEKQPIPEIEIPETPTTQPTPQVQPEVKPTPPAAEKTELPPVETPTPQAQPEVTPTPPAAEKPTEKPESQPVELPTPQVEPEVIPTPPAAELPEEKITQPEKTGFSRDFQPHPDAKPQISPSLPPTLPEIIESPVPQEVTPTPAAAELPEKQKGQPSPSLSPAPAAPEKSKGEVQEKL
ncbi:hypothetical protein Cylst_1748 [Cylindrospermum stagnale PCC 7417]|uniref:FHA domain containing protein n=1 Tax=Cylindrospermum stagnale PCC 7417 TaxID=56107 RepID=K9WW24_9NOST|nr:hypothetical protein [Cylindrospermum stagnale]AFZ24019.1 hypothetical protein Cylst_1748 [Cylindrospermum stagnale PCC 7417]